MAHARNRHEGKRIGIRKLKRLYEETKNWYGAGAYKLANGRLRKYSCNDKTWRKLLQKKIRHTNLEEIKSGGAYRKHVKYWWSIL